MRIHLISDLHLDTGPYVIPEDIDFDVLVVAGDIDENPARGVEFLKTASRGKPSVFVLGNHDVWHECPKSFFDRAPNPPIPFTDKLAQWRAAVEGVENLHLLENESVVIGDTRFLGCTLWTSYAGGSIDHMVIAKASVRDYLYIGAGDWFDTHPGVIEDYFSRFPQDCDREQGLRNFNASWSRNFHPVIAADLHRQSMAFLKQQLQEEGDWQQTVVVTHHVPSWEVLTAGGLVRLPVEKLASLDHIEVVRGRTLHFSRMDRDGSGTYRLGCYASPLNSFLRHECGDVVWMHGHTHAHTDIAIGQCRVVCNPRGYSRGAEYGNDPSSVGFDERFVVDTADGVMPILNAHIDRAIETLKAHADQLKALRPHVNHRTPAIRESVRERAQRFGELVYTLFQETASEVHDATGCDGFHLPGKVLHLPGVEWKARFPQLVYFPSPQPETADLADLAALRDEFPSLSIFADGPMDGGIGAILSEVRAFLRDLERVRTWHQKYPAGMRRVLKPVMALLDSVGADPEFVEAVRIDDLRIEVNPGFRTVDTRPLWRLGFMFMLVEREEGPGPEVSVDEINELVRKRAEELGFKPWP